MNEIQVSLHPEAYAQPVTSEPVHAARAQTLDDYLKTKTLTTGVKYDVEKPRMDLIPPLGLIEVAKVLGYGAKKYSADNWRQVDGKEWRYFGAAQRHLWQYHSGQVFDSETNINHLAHAICSLMFLLELDLEAQAKRHT